MNSALPGAAAEGLSSGLSPSLRALRAIRGSFRLAGRRRSLFPELGTRNTSTRRLFLHTCNLKLETPPMWGSDSGVSTATGYRHIVALPGVRGGRPHVEGTRIGVHDVVAYHLRGCPVEEICGRFPDLTRAQVYECLAYYEDHRAEIEALALDQLKAAGE